MKLKLEEIVTDAGTQARIEINTNAVSEYAIAMQSGDKFPPLDVFQDGKRYLLGDGFHRLESGRKIGLKEMAVEVHKGNAFEAFKFGCHANRIHGLRFTNEDKRNAVKKLLEKMPKQSDRFLADACGVSHEFVRILRNQVSTVDTCGTPEQLKNESENETKTAPEKRTGKDGKTYAMKAKKQTPKTPVKEDTKPADNPPPVQAPVSSPAPSTDILTFEDFVKEWRIFTRRVKYYEFREGERQKAFELINDFRGSIAGNMTYED